MLIATISDPTETVLVSIIAVNIAISVIAFLVAKHLSLKKSTTTKERELIKLFRLSKPRRIRRQAEKLSKLCTEAELAQALLVNLKTPSLLLQSTISKIIARDLESENSHDIAVLALHHPNLTEELAVQILLEPQALQNKYWEHAPARELLDRWTLKTFNMTLTELPDEYAYQILTAHLTV